MKSFLIFYSSNLQGAVKLSYDTLLYQWSLWKIWNIVLRLHKQIFTFKLNSHLIFLTIFFINSQFEAHGVAAYNLKWPFIECLISRGRAACTNSDPVFHLHIVVDKPWILTLAKIRLPVLLKMFIRHWSNAAIVPFNSLRPSDAYMRQ